MELSGFKFKLRNCLYQDSSPFSLYQSGYTKGNSEPLSSGEVAPILHVAHNTLSPKSTYSCPFIEPVVDFPCAVPSQVLEHDSEHEPLHVSLQDEEQSLAQAEHVVPVELPLHVDEQSEHKVSVLPPEQPSEQVPEQVLSQSSMQAASQSSHPPHEVREARTVGAAANAPSIGSNPFAAFLKNRLRFINSLSFILLPSVT